MVYACIYNGGIVELKTLVLFLIIFSGSFRLGSKFMGFMWFYYYPVNLLRNFLSEEPRR